MRKIAGIIDEEGQPIKIPKIGGHKPTSPMGRLAAPARHNSFRQGSTPRSQPTQSSTPR